MRLDKFLFFCRLTKSRTLAQKIVAQGHIRLNGQPIANCHQPVAPGHVITLPLHGDVRVLRVTALPSRRGPFSEAKMHYCDVQAQSPH